MPTPLTATQLAGLAAGLCQDAGIGIEVSDKHWAFDALRRIIQVPRRDLKSRGADYCAGVIAHEVGHYFLSRYVWFPLAFPSTNLLRFFLNSIEDPRVNTWIRRRYPGADRWLALVAREDMERSNRDPLPDFLRFGFECAREEWLAWKPVAELNSLAPRVAEALDDTRGARQAYADETPSPNLVSNLAPAVRTRRYREEVWPSLFAGLARTLPGAWEQEVRLSALDACRLADEEILPVARALLEGDVRRLAAFLTREPGRVALLRLALEHNEAAFFFPLMHDACTEPAAESPREPGPMLEALVLQWIEAILGRMFGQGRPGPLLPPGEPCRSGRGRGRMAAGHWRPPALTPTAYEEARQRAAEQIARFRRQIADLWQPRRRLRDRRGYATGYKADLRMIMAAEADPRRIDRLWLRKTIPARRSAAVLLLVDLSGSMRGDNIQAALAATILFAETLNHLSVPFAIFGFQNVLIPFCDFGDGLTPRVRQFISEIPREVSGDRPGGNNEFRYNDDGPCVEEAAAHLLRRGETDRLLVVLSDGRPEGHRSTEADLRRVITKLREMPSQLKLVGIGVGPNTDHVTECYPESIANVPQEQLAEQIGGLLQRTLLQTT